MMMQTAPQASEKGSEKISRRDWVLLPVIGIVTIFAIGGVTEFVAQRKYPTLAPSGEECTVFKDPVRGPHGKSNCHNAVKVSDSEFTEYRFNACGYRTDLPCGPKPADTFRIVMIGTSFAAGWNVPIEKTLGDLLPKKLSQMTGKNVQLYNESFPYRFPDLTSQHFDQVLEAQPDLILWALNSGDLKRQADAEIPQDDPVVRPLNRREKIERDIKLAFSQGSFEQSISNLFTHSRTYNLLSSLIYASPSQYLKVALADPDPVGGYLKSQPSELWQKRFKNFDEDFSAVAKQAENAHIPLVVTLLPNRAQASMIALGTPPAGYDPYLLDRSLQAMVTAHGDTYFAISPGLSNYPNPQLGFYPVEGHPNALGHEMYTELLATKLALEVTRIQHAGLNPRAIEDTK